MNKNKAAKRYYRQLRKEFPKLDKQEISFLNLCKEAIFEYQDHHPDALINEYYDQFGEPEDIVSSYYEHIESEYVINHMKTRKLVSRFCFIAMIILIITCISLFYIIYNNYYYGYYDGGVYIEEITIDE